MPVGVTMDDEEDPNFGLHHGELAHGLCECKCVGPCCLSFWFNVCQTAKLHSFILNERPPRMWRCCNLPSALFGTGIGLTFGGSVLAAAAPGIAAGTLVGEIILAVQHGIVRTRVLQELGVRESCCATCCTTTFCMPCSSVQLTDTIRQQGHRVRIFME